MDTRELIQKLHSNAKLIRLESAMYIMADLMDDAGRELTKLLSEIDNKETPKPMLDYSVKRDHPDARRKIGGFCPVCEGSVEFEVNFVRKIKGVCCSWCGQRILLPKECRDNG